MKWNDIPRQGRHSRFFISSLGLLGYKWQKLKLAWAKREFVRLPVWLWVDFGSREAGSVGLHVIIRNYSFFLWPSWASSVLVWHNGSQQLRASVFQGSSPEKEKLFFAPYFLLAVPELSHIGLTLIKYRLGQIRYKTIHCAIQLGGRSEGQGRSYARSWSLEVMVREDGVNLQDQIESGAGLLLHKTIQMLLVG